MGKRDPSAGILWLSHWAVSGAFTASRPATQNDQVRLRHRRRGVLPRKGHRRGVPGCDPGPTHIHGISAADLVGAPTFAKIAEELAERVEGAMVVAHNLSFDAGFLSAEYARTQTPLPDQPALCTLQLARHVLPANGGYSLAACAAALGIDHPSAHRALPDTRVTALVLQAMLYRLFPPSDQDTLPFA